MDQSHRPRSLERIIESVPTSDGAGVRLRRSLGRTQFTRLDPLLMLDEFSSYEAGDYIAGFPAHPHRGFETVTYILDGHMLHEDHLGNRGDLQSGGVQWMTAGRGIIHSEMPQQTQGRLRGFQLWLNLPAAEKMKPASYRDLPAATIPAVELAAGARAHVIAGEITARDGSKVAGPIAGLSTAPVYIDLVLQPQAACTLPLPDSHSACLYPYEGKLQIEGAGAAQHLPTHQLGVLTAGNSITVQAGASGARALLLAGRPLNEPVVQYGPFVMNTREEIEQAVRDYQNGTLTRA